TTHAFAEFYFNVAGALRRAPSFQIDAVNRPFVLGVLGLPIDSSAYAVDTVLSGEELERVTAAVFAKGDAFLARVHDIVGHGPQSEQLDRGTGAGLGAEELTWNYASMLSAMRARADSGLE